MGKLRMAGLAALLMIGSVASQAHAVLLSLGLQQGGVNSGAITTVATDSSSPGNLSFTGVYGSFSLGNTGATGFPAAPQPTVNTSVLVSSNSTGGILFVYMTEQGLTSPQGVSHLGSSLVLNFLSGAIGPITLSTLMSASNELYTGIVLAPKTTLSQAGSRSFSATTPDLSGPFSETVVYEVVANGEGSANPAIEISPLITSAPPPVPAPASLALLGVGLAGLGLFYGIRPRARRRRC